MTTTPNLNVNLMATNSLQKEAIFNEAALVFDVLAAGVVINDLTTPPGSPENGDAYIVTATATGAWAGWEGRIAFYFNGWRSITPVHQMKMYVSADGDFKRYNSGSNTWVATPADVVEELGDLTDLTITTPSDGDMLVYDSDTGKWVNQAVPTGYDEIADLEDVDVSTPPTDGQLLAWDAGDSKWKPLSITVPTLLTQLTDINAAGRADGQILVWDEDNSEYVHADPVFDATVDQLTNIGDVDAATPSEGDALVWNGAAWVPGGVPASIDGSTDLADGFEGNANRILRLDPTELELIWVDHTIAALLDFDNDPVPTDGQFMRFRTSDSKWYPATVSIPAALNDLNNVQGTPSSGQVLTWNAGSSQWEPATIPTQLADWKDSVRLAIDTNVNIAGGGIANGVTIQSYTLQTGDRVLLRAQTTGSQNGIYVVPSSGAASRATDADANAEVTTGLTVMVERGDHAGQFMVLTTVGAITVGTTALTFSEMSAGGSDELSEMEDVTITTPANGHFLVFDGADWVNRVPVLSDLDDVDLSTPPTDGQTLRWDEISETWLPGTPTATVAELGDVGDVDLTTPPTDGQVLAWEASSSSWVPTTVEGGGGSSTLEINDQTASYTLVIGDAGKYVRMNVATPNDLTVPPNSSVAFDIGTSIPIRQVGAGQTTVVAGLGVTVNTAETLKLRKQGSGASLIKVATNTWDLVGDLELSA